MNTTLKKSPYIILDIPENSTKEEIKSAYKKIALICHPDKLTNEKDIKIKEEKIEKFKEASYAYNYLINKIDNPLKFQNDFSYYNYNNLYAWCDIWEQFFIDNYKNYAQYNAYNTNELIKDTFNDLASMYIKKEKPNSYYVPNEDDIINHNITLIITYKDLLNNTKKKLRLILADIEEPVYLEVQSKNYPKVNKQYIDNNGIEHDINIIYVLEKYPRYNHIIVDKKNNVIDLITTVEISLIDYIIGCKKEIQYINGKNITLDIPPFENDYFIKKNKGINSGNLIINIIVNYNMDKHKWIEINEKDKCELIRILKNL